MPSDDPKAHAIPAEHFARMAVRYLALILLVLGSIQLIANILESVTSFHPSYLLYFFKLAILRPLLLILGGVTLLVAGGPLARWLARVPASAATKP